MVRGTQIDKETGFALEDFAKLYQSIAANVMSFADVIDREARSALKAQGAPTRRRPSSRARIPWRIQRRDLGSVDVGFCRVSLMAVRSAVPRAGALRENHGGGDCRQERGAGVETDGGARGGAGDGAGRHAHRRR